MIEVVGITKNFDQIRAVSNVSFTVEEGQVLGFLGVNGAGKTTTLDILCGCLGPDEGSVKICGYDIGTDPRAAKSLLGYLPDDPPLHLDMTVYNYVRYVAEIRRVSHKKSDKSVKLALDKLGLLESCQRIIGNLSKGYRQRVGIAAAIVHEPKVLVLDEPTEGLDPSQISNIRELIKELSSDHTILLSSHILSEVEAMCDRILIIDRGQIVAGGTHGELKEQINKKSHQFKVTIKERSSNLVEVLRGFDYDFDFKVLDEHTILLTMVDEKNLDVVLSVIVSNKFGLRSLHHYKSSLEEIFMELTSVTV